MAYKDVIPFQPVDYPADQTLEQQWSAMHLFYQDMIQYRESVPHQFISYPVKLDMVHGRSLGSMTDTSGECIVTTVDAIHIYTALSCLKKVPDTVMDGIEEPLPVEGTAFEYDCKPDHFFLRNKDAKNDVTR